MKKVRQLDIDDKVILRQIEDDVIQDEADLSGHIVTNRQYWDYIFRADEDTEYGDSDQPFNAQLPLCKMAFKQILPQLLQLIDKAVTFEATEEGDLDKVQVNQEYFEFLKNEQIKFDFFDQAFLVLLTEGTIINQLTWERKENVDISVQKFPLKISEMVQGQGQFMGIAGKPQWMEREITQDDILKEIVPEEGINNVKIKEIGEDHIRITYDQHIDNQMNIGSDQWEEKRIEIDFSIDELKGEIVARIETPKVEYEGCKLIIKPRDGVYHPVDAENLQECNHVIIDFITTVSELKAKADRGEYKINDDDWDKIKASARDTRIVKANSSASVEKDYEGASGEHEPPENMLAIEGRECYYLWDVDGKGYQKQIVFTILPEVDLVIRKKYLNEVCPWGMRPIELGVWQPRKYRMLGVGLVEDMLPLQKLLNDLFNMILNAGAIALTPPGFYDPAVVGSNQGVIEYGPGKLTPIPGGAITWLPYPSNFPVGFELIKFLYDLFQRGASTSDQAQGQQGGVKTATATVKLIEMTLSQMGPCIKRVMEWMVRVYKQFWAMNLTFMPEQRKYRVMGPNSEKVFKAISKSDLIYNPDIKLTIAIEELSKDFMVQVAMQIMQSVANPMLIQAGIVNQRDLYNAQKNLLEKLGVKDYHNYITEPQMIESIDPEKEFYMMVEGQEVATMPTDDDVVHMQSHMEKKNTAGQYVAGAEQYYPLIGRIDRHLALHQNQQQQKLLQQQQAMLQMAAMTEFQEQGAGGNKKQAGGPQDQNLQGMIPTHMMPGQVGQLGQGMPMQGIGQI